MRNQTGIAQLFILILLLLGTGLGVYLSLNQTIFKPKAATEPETGFALTSPKLEYKEKDEFDINLWARSDISPANVFSAKLSFDPSQLKLLRLDADPEEETPAISPTPPAASSLPASPTPSPSSLPPVELEYITAQVGCSTPQGLTPDQICQQKGFTRSKKVDGEYAALGYWWRQCGGASINCGSNDKLECKITQFDCTGGGGGLKPHWYNQWGYGYGNENGYSANPNDKQKEYSSFMLKGKNNTVYNPQSSESCSGANPGWTVRVACTRDVLGGGAPATFITTWVKKPSTPADFETANTTGVVELSGGIGSGESLKTKPETPALMATLRFKIATPAAALSNIMFIKEPETPQVISAITNSPITPLKTNNLLINLNGFTPQASPIPSPIISKSPESRGCVQVITKACNNSNLSECRDFPTPCEIPPNWSIEKRRSTTTTPTPTPSPRPVTNKGDANSDGKVNLADFSIALSYVNKKSSLSKIDFNDDGKINSIDIASLIKLLK